MNGLTERQKEILSTVINIISEKGIQNLTIKNLSKEIGFSEAAIYRHFKSKIDILLTILSVFESKMRENNAQMDSEANSSLEKLYLIFKNNFNNFSENSALASVIFSEEIFQDDKRLSDKIYSIMSYNFEFIKTIIKKGQKNKEIRSDINSDQLIIIIMGSLRLIIKKWKLSNYSFDLKKEGQKLWKSLNKLLSI
jgi:AcrR family transcriptional regulator